MLIVSRNDNAGQCKQAVIRDTILDYCEHMNVFHYNEKSPVSGGNSERCLARAHGFRRMSTETRYGSPLRLARDEVLPEAPVP